MCQRVLSFLLGATDDENNFASHVIESIFLRLFARCRCFNPTTRLPAGCPERIFRPSFPPVFPATRRAVSKRNCGYARRRLHRVGLVGTGADGAQRAGVGAFHGLEGDSHSHYAEALMHECVKCGWRGVVAHFRGCGGLPNRLPRAYFAGDSDDCDWVLRTVHERFITAPIYAVGVSLGGNYIAKYMGERPQEASFLTAAVSIGAPVDLVAGSEIMSRGANKLYEEMFLSTLKEKLIDKAKRFPDLIDINKVKSCKTLYDFDSVYTARSITSRARWSIGPCARQALSQKRHQTAVAFKRQKRSLPAALGAADGKGRERLCLS